MKSGDVQQLSLKSANLKHYSDSPEALMAGLDWGLSDGIRLGLEFVGLEITDNFSAEQA